MRIGRRYVGVDFDDVGAVLLCQRLCALDELGERLAVVQIAHGAAAAVHERAAHHGHGSRHEREGAFDFAVFAAHGDGLPAPHGLLFAPEDALGKIALRVRLHKGFVFRKRFFRNDLVHDTAPYDI